MVSLDGGDVSDFIGVVGSTAEEEQDDVFDDILISSLSEPSPESEAISSPGWTYSMQDLTKVDLYDTNGSLLFTVREKSSCTFGNLAENLHTKIREKNQSLQCFTFKETNTASLDPNQELGFQYHRIVVLPATDGDQWGDWRIDDKGIVELRQL
ncbi:uncharacterized protein LOC116289834 [Actinia tenebrosa]|uniref:Uncharacterized protein LOC116289834 n=1 Tax=Actinia tenebrosa TaxID=6105 RepID=A0A6P8H856_ACTTE|nr:uncharacterized protein LOC116289834 [Actinia tenebrosa]